uniref:Uncharacterized protein n=1 Tax=Hyaloperonospora arabidopsidis (strain Emoy2) TaxID=559515 RepID=M4BWP8_HYAAE
MTYRLFSCWGVYATSKNALNRISTHFHVAGLKEEPSASGPSSLQATSSARRKDSWSTVHTDLDFSFSRSGRRRGCSEELRARVATVKDQPNQARFEPIFKRSQCIAALCSRGWKGA